MKTHNFFSTIIIGCLFNLLLLLPAKANLILTVSDDYHTSMSWTWVTQTAGFYANPLTNYSISHDHTEV